MILFYLMFTFNYNMAFIFADLLCNSGYAGLFSYFRTLALYYWLI